MKVLIDDIIFDVKENTTVNVMSTLTFFEINHSFFAIGVLLDLIKSEIINSFKVKADSIEISAKTKNIKQIL